MYGLALHYQDLYSYWFIDDNYQEPLKHVLIYAHAYIRIILPISVICCCFINQLLFSLLLLTIRFDNAELLFCLSPHQVGEP